jgi:uncharacterized protein (DUF58 family)
MRKWFTRKSGSRRRRRSGFGISAGSVMFVVGTALIGMAAVDADINLLMIVFGLCLSAMAVSIFSGWKSLRALEVSRQVPDTLVAGQLFEVRYTIRNRRRWGYARGLHIVDHVGAYSPVTEVETYVGSVPPGESLITHAPVRVLRRGRIEFNRLRVETRFPFGFVTKYIEIEQPREVIAFPALGRLLADVMATSHSLDAPGGGVQARSLGDEEYYGVREYREGDNPRRIHWRRTARTGQLMVREMARSSERQLWCVVDTRVHPDDRKSADALEAAICFAATVICDGLERGVKVGLICNGRPLVVLPPGGGRAHRPRLLRELAEREENTDDPLSPHLEKVGWPARWRGRCMLFAGVESDDLRRAANSLRRVLGPTSVYVAGSPAFDAAFSPAVALPPSPGETLPNTGAVA